MSSSIKLISPTNPEKWVFITHESGWKNTKIYANGKLIKSFENPQELKKGIVDEIDGLGMMKFSLHPATLRPLLIVKWREFF